MAASMRRCQKLVQLLRPYLAHRSVSTTPVLSGYWNKDWKPGPYPKTPQERAAAAKKYGLRVEDYEPYADDGTGYGDYPKLRVESADGKDDYFDWDMPELKRNFNEPLHVDMDIYGADRCNPDVKLRYSYKTMAAVLGTFLSVFIGIYLLSLQYPRFIPIMPKQYPFNDLYLENGGIPEKEPTIKHYTFESAD